MLIDNPVKREIGKYLNILLDTNRLFFMVRSEINTQYS